MSLEDLEKELYSGREVKERIADSESPHKNSSQQAPPYTTESPWSMLSSSETDAPSGAGFGWYWKVAFAALIFILIGLAGLASFYLYQYFTTKDVSLTVLAPEEVSVGVPFAVSVTLENLSGKTLQDPRISLALPDGVVYLDDSAKRVVSLDLDPLAPAEIARRDFSFVIVGSPLSTYRLENIFSYRYDSSNLSSTFNKKKTVELLARDPIITLELSAPDKVLSGEDFELNVLYEYTGQETLSNARIALFLPRDLRIINSDPVIGSDGVITLTSLAPGERGAISLSATIQGKPYSFFSVDAVAQISLGSFMYDITKKSASISLSPSPLSLAIALSSGSTTTYPGEILSYQLTFSNNADINLSDVVLSATLVGDLFDVSSVQSDGHFNDTNKTITWTAVNNNLLKELRARESGSVSFRVRVKKTLPSNQLSDKNFSVRVLGEIVSPTVPYSVIAKKTIATADIETFIGGQINFAQQAYFNESSVDIDNNGILPPRVGFPTEYTIHWTISALSTDWESTRIRAFLGPGVLWTGKVKTNAKTAPTYNERTQEIIWDVGQVYAGRGSVDPSLYAIFQVSIRPSVNQVGDAVILVNSPTLSAYDTFIAQSVTRSLRAISIRDLSDQNLPSGFDKVAP